MKGEGVAGISSPPPASPCKGTPDSRAPQRGGGFRAARATNRPPATLPPALEHAVDEEEWAVYPIPVLDDRPGRWRLHFPKAPHLDNTRYETLREARKAVRQHLENTPPADPVAEAEAALRKHITPAQWRDLQHLWKPIVAAYRQVSREA